MKRFLLIFFALCLCLSAEAKRPRDIVGVVSPCGNNLVSLDWREGELRWWAYSYQTNTKAVEPSALKMVTSKGVWGENVGRGKIKTYKHELYNSAVVEFDGYAVELRAYDDGVAYRFISNTDGDYVVVDELAEFGFGSSDMAWVPYVNFKLDATSDYSTQF